METFPLGFFIFAPPDILSEIQVIMQFLPFLPAGQD